MRPSASPTAADALVQVLKDVVTYRNMNCYEVLEALFRGCRIFQRNGEWWIVSNEKWQSESITWHHYSAAGVEGSLVVTGSELSGFWFEGEGTLGFLPAMKQLSVDQVFGYKDNLIGNSDFSKFDSGNFDGWTAVGVTPEQRVYDADGNKYVYIPGVERLDPWDTANRTRYLVSDAIPVAAASDLFKISFYSALMGPLGSSAYVFFGAFLEGDDGNNYALNAYIYTDNWISGIREVRYWWIQESHKLAVPVACSYNKKYSTSRPEPDRIPAYPYNEVADHFTQTSITVEGGIPTSGTLRLYLFQAHTGSIVAGSCFRNIKLMLTDEDENEYITGVGNILVNDLRNNYVPDDMEMVNVDLPQIANRLTIYDNGFIINDGGLQQGKGTTLWQLDGHATVYPYAELVARLIAAEMQYARQAYAVSLADATPATALVFTDPNNGSRRFVEAGITYNDRMQTIQGRYVEVKEFNIDAFTWFLKSESSEKPGSSSGGGGTSQPTLLATDEKVKLIDPETYSIEGQAGYLSSDDFEQEIDEDSGRAVIKISHNGIKVTQVSHGFSVKNAIRHNGSMYVKAQADTAENAQTAGIVSNVIDADTFFFMTDGILLNEDFTPGTEYFLSPSVPGLVAPEPESWNIGEVRQSLGWGTPEGLKVEIDVGDEIYAETEETGEDVYVDSVNIDETAKVTMGRTGEKSDLTLQLGMMALKGFWVGTLEAYNAIEVKDENVIYHIEE